MSIPARLVYWSVVALLGCGSTVVVANPATDAGSPPADRGASPTDTGSPSPDRPTPIVDVPGTPDAGRVCILANGVRCPAGQSCSDGCNTCYCPADGGPVGCTARACVDAGAPSGCATDSDCGPGRACSFRAPGCGLRGECGPLTDCAAITPYCGCDGVTFRDCPGSPHRPWMRASECGPEDAGVAPDAAICAGASIGPNGGYCAGPADGPLPLDCCRGWNCDDRSVTCGGMPEPCEPGYVHLVTLSCWGSCVRADHCAPIAP